jgi:hypothetical protein
VLFGSSFGLDPLKRGKKPWIPFCFGVLFSPVDLMGFSCVPGCGVDKDKSGLKGAAGVEFITEFTSVSLVGGLEEQGGDLSLPGIGGFAGATEGRSSFFFLFFS